MTAFRTTIGTTQNRLERKEAYKDLAGLAPPCEKKEKNRMEENTTQQPGHPRLALTTVAPLSGVRSSRILPSTLVHGCDGLLSKARAEGLVPSAGYSKLSSGRAILNRS